jgi:hypothetical protein
VGVVYRCNLVYLDLAPRKCITKGDGWTNTWMDMGGWMDLFIFPVQGHIGNALEVVLFGWFINNKFSGVPF